MPVAAGAVGLAFLLVVGGCAARGTPAQATEEPVADRPSGVRRPVLMAGAAVRVITPYLSDPSRPVYMAGLERGLKATGVHDDLHARALVVTDGAGVSVGLVALDLIGLFHDDVEELKADLARRHPEVHLEHLAVACTHTHAGPDVMGLWLPLGSTVDGAYVERVRGEAVEAVAQAWSSRRPVTLWSAESLAPGLARDTRLPDLIDDAVLVLGFRDLDGDQGVASLVNWNSHPSVAGGENTEISADFPRGVIARVEAEWGGTALYVSGDLGGQIGSGRIRILDPETGAAPESRMRKADLIGDRIGRIALEALATSRAGAPAASFRVRVQRETLFVPLDNPRFAQGLGIGLIRPRRLYLRDRPDSGRLPSDLEDPTSLKAGAYALKTETALIDLGPVRLAMIPGELYPEIALGRYQEPQDPGADFPGAPRETALRPLAGRPLFLIGLANDELGYLIPKSQWDVEPPHTYGLDEPQYGESNSVGPEAASIVVESLARMLRRHR